MNDITKEHNRFSIDIGDTPIEKVKAFFDTTTKTELVLVECIQQYRVRYVVEVPVGKSDWALDTVTCDEAKEFSQYSLGETIVSHRVVSKEEMFKICDEDNEYCHTWTDEQKFDVFVTTDDEDLMEY